MRIAESEADAAFRAEFRDWLEVNLPAEIRSQPMAARIAANGGDEGVPQWSRDWQALLFDSGWLVPQWPRELGGRDATPQQTLVYFEELARVHAPRTLNFQGLCIVSPSLREFGTPEQQERWLVKALRADELWCIGMSEPGAGSDLGGLSTRAQIEGDTAIINGQKVWTSSAHHADWCLVYTRTGGPDTPKHKGISVFAVDMRTPGIDVRPFPHITGQVDFAEVFFTDVPVPLANLVGSLDDGWRVTMGSLAHERGGLWVQGVAMLEEMHSELVRRAKELGRLEDPAVAVELAHYLVEVESLKALGYKGFASFAQQSSSPEHSLLKLSQAETWKSLSEFGTRLLGPWGPVLDSPSQGADGLWPMAFFASFAATIAGGTSEIQRNIIAERVLGLPRQASS